MTKDLFEILVTVTVNVSIGEYLDYENWKCRKKLFYKLIEECTESIDEVEIAGENEHKNKFSSIFFTISIGTTIYFVYTHWYL